MSLNQLFESIHFDPFTLLHWPASEQHIFQIFTESPT